MDVARRKALRNGAGFTMLALAAAGGLLRPGAARAEWNTKAFDTRSLAETVKADGKFYYTATEVKVTLGGCGG